MARPSHLRLLCILFGITLALLFSASMAAAHRVDGPAQTGLDTPGLASCTVILMGQVTDGTSPLSGALVRAYTGGQPAGLTSTDRSGNFMFANPGLPAKVRYQLGVQPVGLPEVRYGPYGPFNCGAIANVGTLVYGSTRSIQGTIWSDRNGDGRVQSSEQRRAGWPVILHRQGSDQPVATTTTNSQGFYKFPDLVPGTYKVTFVDPGRSLSYSSGWFVVSTANRTVDFDHMRKRVYVR